MKEQILRGIANLGYGQFLDIDLRIIDEAWSPSDPLSPTAKLISILMDPGSLQEANPIEDFIADVSKTFPSFMVLTDDPAQRVVRVYNPKENCPRCKGRDFYERVVSQGLTRMSIKNASRDITGTYRTEMVECDHTTAPE